MKQVSEFRTIVVCNEFQHKISYYTPCIFLGSCFTENIGNKMQELKFTTLTNPFGIIYNPISIKNSIELIIQNQPFTENHLYHDGALWHSFYHHSKFSNINLTDCLQRLNNSLQQAANFLKKAQFLFITFGTAVIYKHNKTDIVVSNCHKLPSSEFTTKMLSAQEIVDSYNGLLEDIYSYNSSLQIIFTVSPIRHLKLGAEKNMLSKAILIQAIHHLKQYYPVHYFPAYEIVMDDLRDYRFYADDMIHLNNIAIDYIWNKFVESLIDKESHSIMNQIDKINKAIQHKPFFPNTQLYKEFVSANLQKIIELETKYPFLSFKDEKIFLTNVI